MKPVNKPKKKLSSHAFVIAALSFVLALTIMEIVFYAVQTVNIGLVVDTAFIMLYILPGFSLLITAVIIYINHRTFQTSSTLMEAIDKVAAGNFSVTIPYKRLDNFNRVYENFNKMTAELRGVETLREDFVHNFSHEFKTPIASINGFANLLLDGNLTREEQMQIIKIIADESARLSNLSENVLLISRIESQQFVGENKPFRLDLQMTDCIILLQRQWEEKNIDINSELSPVIYSGDAQLIKQIWLNLLNNAIKYTPERGSINVRLTADGNRITASVSDTGVGIPEESLPKIFDKYYQVGSGKGKGNGLGLAICRRICELCGGSIAVESKVGEGTTFTVKL